MPAFANADAGDSKPTSLLKLRSPLSPEVRGQVARRILSWALPTMGVVVLLVFMLAVTARLEPSRFATNAIWTAVLVVSAAQYRRERYLHAAGVLLVGLTVVTTSGTLLHGVDAPAMVGFMPVIVLTVPLFGMGWGCLLLVWLTVTGVLRTWLEARGLAYQSQPLSAEIYHVYFVLLAVVLLAFLHAPMQLLASALDASEKRFGELKLAREREQQAASALRSAGEQLAAARRLEALGKLSGGVAHDFNNMLGAILGATDLIEHGRRYADDAELKGNVALIRTATERAAELTRKLLAFGRKDNFGEMQRIDIDALLSEIAVLSRSVLGAIELEVLPAGRPLCVIADRSALEHMMLNLLLNARDAMSGTGVVKVSTRLVILEPAWCEASGFGIAPGQAVQVSVEDFGTGMSPEVCERIFEPFFTTKQIGRGTGLGLSAVHGTVINHRGAIEVKSQVGRGTVFHIYLPLDTSQTMPRDRDASASSSSQAPRAPQLHRGIVLVVDDDDLAGGVTAGLVRQLGYDCEHVSDAEAALAELETRDDVLAIVSDVVMHPMDGPALVRAVALRRPRIALVLMTGFAPEGALQDLPKARPIPVLRKPFGRPEIEDALRAALESAELRPA